MTWARIVKLTRIVAWTGFVVGMLALADTWQHALAVGATFVCGYALGNVEAR